MSNALPADDQQKASDKLLGKARRRTVACVMIVIASLGLTNALMELQFAPLNPGKAAVFALITLVIMSVINGFFTNIACKAWSRYLQGDSDAQRK